MNQYGARLDRLRGIAIRTYPTGMVAIVIGSAVI